jgi:acetolactate synthase-1/3 small subunit
MTHTTQHITDPDMPHTLLVYLQDKPGALHRAVTLFRRRGDNISSLHVDRSETPGISRMTVAVDAPSAERLTRELERLVDVLSVRNVTGSSDLAPTALMELMQADGCCDVEELS